MSDSETDYNTSTINVSPVGMSATAKSLNTLSQTVADSLSTINTELSALRVAWQGQAATDAEAVNKQWMHVMTRLFGTEDEPGKGVLSALAGGLDRAAANFSKAERGVTSIFTDFHDGLQPEEDGDGGSKEEYPTEKPDNQTDTNNTAVTLTFPK
ncbi:WXG100 family type VII secretion target [Streptomyces sp. XM4193]|uniref:WXG100 family type VII secretion target n=1 Tax=Streptomyces sp. XM4193 TaxID=2929782 RepID=UPI001FF8302B|nr:WXG100 family type VII secretion target [Streptomyces sp. XM4193]MCK1797056.1 WXG100 family type VII secretion target [Streptomyces sp. XM4193]